MSDVVATGSEREPRMQKTPRKAAFSSWVGTALEYYDLFIYGTAAALIFPRLFFPAGNPTAATIASLASFGVAYLARPLGAFILGHLGDTIGRKTILVVTLFGMGVSTFLIGVLPTYEQVGLAAPILLTVLRLCQGLAVSAEPSSASSTTLEHSPANRRGFFTSFTQSGSVGGSILATAVFIPVSALPADQLLSWGWRVPFLLSAVVVLVGWWIRRSLQESPAFKEQQEHRQAPTAPLAVLWRDYRSDVVKVILGTLNTVSLNIFQIYALTYAVNTMQMSRISLLLLQVVALAIALFTIPAAGALADRIGRRPLNVIGSLGSAAMVWPFIWALSQRDLLLASVSGITLMSIFNAASGGTGYALWSEQFDTKVRMSGLAVSTQLGFILGGFAPTIAAALAGPDLANWTPVALFSSAAAVVAGVAAMTMRETYKVHLHDLGRPESAVSGAPLSGGKERQPR
jgi:MFS family permease